jgi:hypothetical protein
MDNIATIAPYKLDGFKKNMDNVHSLKDPNIRMILKHQVPMSPSEPAEPFLELFVR